MKNEPTIKKSSSSIQHRIKLFRFLIISAVLIFVIIIFILFNFRMEEVVYASGAVAGESDYELRTMVESSITKVLKKEGELVKQDEVIIELDNRNLLGKIDEVKNQIKELGAEVKVKASSLKLLRKDPLPDHLRYTEIALEECKEKFLKTKEKLKTYRDLRKKGVVSKYKLDQIEAEHLTNTANLQRALENYKTVKAGYDREVLEKAVNELKLLNVKLENKVRELTVLNKQLEDYTIRAPAPGKITEIPYEQGRYFKKGEIAAKMSTIRKKLTAYVDERNIYKINPGQRARITSNVYHHYDFGYFTGQVSRIEELPIRKDGRLLYPVEVLITDEPYELKFGSGAEVMIITGKERIITALLGMNK